MQNGYSNYLTVLIDKCGQLVTHNVKKYLPLLKRYNIDVDDFKQHLYLSFIECVNKFPTEHENFIAYTFTYLHNSSLQYIPNDYDKQNDLSLNYEIGKDEKDDTLLDTIPDINSYLEYENIENKMIQQNAKENIRNILSKIVSNNDIDLLYDIYGLTGTHSLTDLCIKYNLSINEIICWERLIILTIQTSDKINRLYDELYSNVTSAYNYTYARWKYTRTSSTEFIAIENIYIRNKIELLKERVKIGMSTLHKNIANATPDCDTVRITPNWNKETEPKNDTENEPIIEPKNEPIIEPKNEPIIEPKKDTKK